MCKNCPYAACIDICEDYERNHDKPTQTGMTRKEYMKLYARWYKRVNPERIRKYHREYMRERRANC